MSSPAIIPNPPVLSGIPVQVEGNPHLPPVLQDLPPSPIPSPIGAMPSPTLSRSLFGRNISAEGAPIRGSIFRFGRPATPQ